MPARRPAVSLAVLALGLSACGSTIAQTTAVGGAQPGGSPGADLGGGTSGGGSGAVSGSSTGGSDSTGGPTGGFAGTSGTSTGSAGTAGTTTTGIATGGGTGTGAPTNPIAGFSGPGITATTITVGIAYVENAQVASAALGVTNVNTGDPLASHKAIIDDINAHGGIGGRKLLYVAHPIDASSTESYSTQATAECADFTQDHKVFAVLDDTWGDAMRECAQKAGAVQVASSAQAFTSTRTFQRFPYFVLPGNIRQDRITAEWTPALQAQGYFTKWDVNTGKPGVAPMRVGILTLSNDEDNHAVDRVLVPALARLGIPSEVVKVTQPQGTADNGSTLSAIQGAVVKFRGDGVTHFLALDSGAGLGLYFGKNASSQKYYPRYGLNSGNGMQLLIDAGLMPLDQLNGALGYGWEPVLDIDRQHDPDNGPYSNASRRRCLALMKRKSINTSGAPATRGALEFCDAYWFFKAAVEAGGPDVSRGSFLAGVNRLGTSFEAGTTFRTSLSPVQHDGVAAYRFFRFDNTCGCLLYSGNQLRALP